MPLWLVTSQYHTASGGARTGITEKNLLCAMPSANVLPALPPLALTSALLLQTRTPRSGEVK